MSNTSPTGDTGQLPAIRRDTVEVPSGRYPTVVVRSSHRTVRFSR